MSFELMEETGAKKTTSTTLKAMNENCNIEEMFYSVKQDENKSYAS